MSFSLPLRVAPALLLAVLLLTVLLLAVLLLTVACAVEPPACPPPIVLVTLSGLRVDAVGALGGEPGWTPHIDALAREADFVGTAVVASSAPTPALVSLMTGVTPWQHQVLSRDARLPRVGLTLLAQALGEAGYRTAAHVPQNYPFARYGLLAGFAETVEIDSVTEVAQVLELRGDPVFSWFHLREASADFERRDAQLPRLAGRSAALQPRFTRQRLLALADPLEPLPAEERAVAWELFCHEVAWADHQLGVLLDSLRASGGWERSWVVVTATQGMELGEHGQMLYAQNLGRESIEVPLLIKLPSSPRRPLAVLGGRVGQVRLWATLVEAAGGRVLPAHAPSLFRPGEPSIVSELYQRNGVNTFSLVRGDLQLTWTSRFAPSEPEFYRAQSATSGGGHRLAEPARRIFGRLEKAYRRVPPFSGDVGESPELRLERWTRHGTERLDDPARARELAAELRRRWARSVDRERTPEEESAASG